MTTLVTGATGATGKLLVEQLLDRGGRVKAIVRSADRVPDSLAGRSGLSLIEASVLDLTDDEMVEHLGGCTAVASCLGHNLTFKGVFGHPRRLVTEATRRLCRATKAANRDGKVKFVLMNTTGNRNRDLDEPISFAQKCVIGLLRCALPPHADNEDAADFLRVEIGQDDRVIDWSVVRPDGLTNEDEVSDYDLHPSPTRSAIFDAGKTSRINVAHFMADLITDPEIWDRWRGKMPVIYNRETGRD